MQKPSRYIGVFVLLLSLVGCGWVEVPFEGQQSYKPATSSPKEQTTEQPKAIPGTVIVEKGDTVYAISRKYDVSVRGLIERNALQPPFHLKIGQRLYLPRGPVHVVKSGDTLYSVSRQYHTDVYTLAKNNNLKSPFILTPGQRLKVPSSSNLTTASKNLKTKPRIQTDPKTKPVRKTVAKTAPRINREAIPKPPPRSSSRFAWPVEGRVISRFGAKRDGLRNDGINIAAKRGTSVKAAENGVVAYAGNELRGFGNMILVKHSGGWITAYAHVEKLQVNRGQKVKRGETIANVGSSGSVVTPQLHFEIRRGMNPVNPNKFLKS